MSKWLVTAAIVAATSGEAHAGAWSFTAICGACGENGAPAVIDQSNKYATEAECNGSRADEEELAGMTGANVAVGACTYNDADTPNDVWPPPKASTAPAPEPSFSSDTPPSSSSSYTPPPQRHAYPGDWQLAALLGPGWTLRDQSGKEQYGDGSIGLDASISIGARAVQFRAGVEAIVTHVQDDMLGSGEHALALVPVMIGIEGQPALHEGRVDIRIDAAASFGAMLHLGCDGCQGAPWDKNGTAAAELRGGLAFYWGEDHAEGVSIDVVDPFLDLGDATDMSLPLRAVSPRVLVRVAWIHRRNDD